VAIARRLGCRRVLVPEPGAALAAAGALLSDLTARYHAVFHTASGDFDRTGVNAVRRGSRRSAAAFAQAAGVGERFRIDWSTEARYPDQAWEIEVPLADSRSPRPRTSPGCSPISTAPRASLRGERSGLADRDGRLERRSPCRSAAASPAG